MINLTMKNRIMFGVYALYCIRKLQNPLIAESFLFAILGATLLYFVSIPRVLNNMSTAESSFRYFVVAFSHTDHIVQSILILVAITGLFFVRNITLHAILKTRFA